MGFFPERLMMLMMGREREKIVRRCVWLRLIVLRNGGGYVMNW